MSAPYLCYLSLISGVALIAVLAYLFGYEDAKDKYEKKD